MQTGEIFLKIFKQSFLVSLMTNESKIGYGVYSYFLAILPSKESVHLLIKVHVSVKSYRRLSLQKIFCVRFYCFALVTQSSLLLPRSVTRGKSSWHERTNRLCSYGCKGYFTLVERWCNNQWRTRATGIEPRDRNRGRRTALFDNWILECITFRLITKNRKWDNFAWNPFSIY